MIHGMTDTGSSQVSPPTAISERRARWMFWWAVGTTLLTSLVLPHLTLGTAYTVFLHPIARFGLFLSWLVIAFESLLSIARIHDSPRAVLRRFLWICAIPPLRLGFATGHSNELVWLPWKGWVKRGDDSYEDLQRKIAWPMVLVTLAVIPVLLGEWWCGKHEDQAWAQFLVHSAMALIWTAFMLEFVLSFAVSERKLEYCKFHWINLVIIVIPLVSFLRAVSLMRFLGLSRVPQLLRAFRFRSLYARGIQVALVFDLVDRFLQRDPEKYVVALERRIRDKERELEELQGQLAEFRAKAKAMEEGKETPESEKGPSQKLA